MNEPSAKTENPHKNATLYTSKVMVAATFFGGPLAAGYMIGENFKALGKPDAGRSSIILGILATIAVFLFLFTLPEQLVDRIPRPPFPLIYTVLIYLLVEKYQGNALKDHQFYGNSFHSGWRTAGIALITGVILVGFPLAYAFYGMNTEIYEQYDAQISVFLENKEKTLPIYDRLESSLPPYLIDELESFVIPKWEENVKIIQKSGTIQDLPSDLVKHNEILLQYVQLRLQVFQLIKKTL